MSRRLLGSTGLTLVLLVILVAIDTLSELDGDLSRPGAWRYFFESLFAFLPLAAALIVGQMVRLDMRAIGIVCALITLLMVGQDFLPPSELTVLKRDFGYTLVSQEWAIVETFDLIRWTEGGSFPLVVDYLTGKLPVVDEQTLPLPEGSERVQVAWAMFKFGYLLGPFIVVGFVVALRVWVDRHVRFRTRSAERVFSFVVSWLVGPIALGLLLFVGDRTVTWGVGPIGPTAILIPFLMFGVSAAFGWRAGLRAERRAAYLDDVPLEE